MTTGVGRSRSRKATFYLPEDVLGELDDAVARGAAPSKNALVQAALSRELAEIRRRERRARWEAAMRDPLFLRDLDDVEAAFDRADAESVGDAR